MRTTEAIAHINIPHANMVPVSSQSVPIAIAAGAVDGGVAMATHDPIAITVAIAGALRLGMAPDMTSGTTMLDTNVTVTALVAKLVTNTVMLTIANTHIMGGSLETAGAIKVPNQFVNPTSLFVMAEPNIIVVATSNQLDQGTPFDMTSAKFIMGLPSILIIDRTIRPIKGGIAGPRLSRNLAVWGIMPVISPGAIHIITIARNTVKTIFSSLPIGFISLSRNSVSTF
ncbi:MAG: hypothetical protein SAMD01599839_00300 [Rectinema sp.]